MTILAVANRKGGVGKSTTTAMIANAFAVWGKQRVLIVDLDAQCNTSLILFGGQSWSNARTTSRTISDYFGDRFDHQERDFGTYYFHEVGDVTERKGSFPQISLVPGSVELEDIEHELLHRVTAQANNLHQAEQGVIARMARLLRDLQRDYPIVIFDCPPGLSFATQAALKIADKIIVPFRPDFVSQFAVDRISRMIEGKANLLDVNAIPHTQRRYLTLANFVTDDVAAQERIQDMEDYHPVLETRIPVDEGIAASFSWRGNRISMEEKYGRNGVKAVRALWQEIKSAIVA
jgi:chromosome partitioning protein